MYRQVPAPFTGKKQIKQILKFQFEMLVVVVFGEIEVNHRDNKVIFVELS